MFLGIDPDLHCTAWAVCDDYGQITHVGTIKISKKFKDQNAALAMSVMLGDDAWGVFRRNDLKAVMVESQELYFHGPNKGVNKKDVMLLANVSGAAISVVVSSTTNSELVLFLPKPQTWKGSVPKNVHQMRTISKLGWKGEQLREYSRPIDFQDSPMPEGAMALKAGDWKHVMDAVSLSLKCRETYQLALRSGLPLGGLALPQILSGTE